MVSHSLFRNKEMLEMRHDDPNIKRMLDIGRLQCVKTS